MQFRDREQTRRFNGIDFHIHFLACQLLKMQRLSNVDGGKYMKKAFAWMKLCVCEGNIYIS